MLKFRLLLFLPACLLFFGPLADAQTGPAYSLLNTDKISTPFYLDPYEAQSMFAVFPHFENGQDVVSGLYMPAAIGFYRNIMNWKLPEKEWEWGIEVVVFPQLETGLGDNSRFWALFNTDFKFGLSGSIKLKERWLARVRLFHLSSHLGDDFILRNRINGFREGEISYEQFDLTACRMLAFGQAYAGAGLVMRTYTPREPWSFWTGFTFRLPAKKHFTYCGGVHIHSRGVNHYTPSYKLAFGLAVSIEEKVPFRLMLEGFSGFLPYSWFEFSRTQWAGIALYVDPF